MVDCLVDEAPARPGEVLGSNESVAPSPRVWASTGALQVDLPIVYTEACDLCNACASRVLPAEHGAMDCDGLERCNTEGRRHS